MRTLVTCQYNPIESEKITVSEILLREIVLERPDDHIEVFLRPIIDMIRNASGDGRSPNFDGNKKFIRPTNPIIGTSKGHKNIGKMATYAQNRLNRKKDTLIECP
jgi:hypothetical protein